MTSFPFVTSSICREEEAFSLALLAKILTSIPEDTVFSSKILLEQCIHVLEPLAQYRNIQLHLQKIEAFESYGPSLKIQRVLLGIIFYLLSQPCIMLEISLSHQSTIEGASMLIEIDYKGALDGLEIEMNTLTNAPVSPLDLGLTSSLQLLAQLKGEVQTFYMMQQSMVRIRLNIPYKCEENIIDFAKYRQKFTMC